MLASANASERASAVPSTRDGVPELQLRAGTPSDRDGDGIGNAVDGDDDNDLIADEDEPAGDADGDGVPNAFDADADNDGIADLVEAVGDRALLARLDANDDGLLDEGVALGANGMADIAETRPDSGRFTTGRLDGDGDGVSDPYDLDSDNDGLSDLVEAGGSDADGNARVDRFRDFDGDGRDDQLSLFPIVPRDTDSDGRFDFRDLDSDGDGASDRRESSGIDTDGDGIVDGFRDVDGDGLDDRLQGAAVVPIDGAGDRRPDHLDPDTVPPGALLPPPPEPTPAPTPDPPVPGPSTPPEPSPEPAPPGPTPEVESDASSDGTANVGAGRPVTGRAGNPIGGCSIGAPLEGRASGTPDASLGVLLLLAFAALGERARRRRPVGADSAATGAAAVAATALVLGGCASFELPRDALDIDAVHAGVGIGISRLDADTDGTTFVADERGSTSAQATLGATFAPWLDAEIRVADLGEMTFVGGGDIGYRVIDAGAVLRRERGRLGWFGRIGLGALFNDGDVDVERRNPAHLLIGAGVDVRVATDWRLRVEASGHDVDAVHGGIGLVYRFGRSTGPSPVRTVRAEPTPSRSPVDPVAAPSAPERPTATPRGELLIEPIAARTPSASPFDTDSDRRLPDIAPRTGSTDLPFDGVSNEPVPNDSLPEDPASGDPAPGDPAPGDPVSRDPVSRDPAPRNPVPRDATPRNAAPSDRELPETPEPRLPAPDTETDDQPLEARAGATVSAPAAPAAIERAGRFDVDDYDIRFDIGSDRLTATARRSIVTLAGALEASPATELAIVARSGLATDPGADLLSRRRVLAVVRALGDAGVDVARLRPEVRSTPGASTDDGRVRLVERNPAGE